MKLLLTPKQEEWLYSQDARINVLDGAVRTGKTFIGLTKWGINTLNYPKTVEHIMIGKTLTALKRNCFSLMEHLFGSKYFSYSLSQKQAKLFGRTVWLEGANDAQAEYKIRGMTLGSAYIDEITLIPQDFYRMLLSRLSVKDARLYATTNPDNPRHYVYTDIINNSEIDKRTVNFRIEDNTFLDPEYVDNLKREYTGIFYQRYIEGAWVVAEGLVYDLQPAMLTSQVEIPTRGLYYISIDYGITNPFAATLYLVTNKCAYAVKEYCFDSKKENRRLTDEEHYANVEKMAKNYPIESIIIDPSATSFKETIERHDKYDYINANNEVIAGIQNTAMLLAAGMLKISEECTNLIDELGLYRWDDKSEKDSVIKESDHFCDQFRYFVNTILKYEYDYLSWS